MARVLPPVPIASEPITNPDRDTFANPSPPSTRTGKGLGHICIPPPSTVAFACHRHSREIPAEETLKIPFPEPILSLYSTCQATEVRSIIIRKWFHRKPPPPSPCRPAAENFVHLHLPGRVRNAKSGTIVGFCILPPPAPLLLLLLVLQKHRMMPNGKTIKYSKLVVFGPSFRAFNSLNDVALEGGGGEGGVLALFHFHVRPKIGGYHTERGFVCVR